MNLLYDTFGRDYYIIIALIVKLILCKHLKNRYNKAGDRMRIKEDVWNQTEIKKSKFICYLHRCFSEADAKDFLLEIKRAHPDASHHCYAMIIKDQLTRSNDDGEPHGTAGLPMLETLKGHQLQDIVAVTVRYFGGTLLGTGGLIRAYSGSVSEAIQHAVLTETRTMNRYQLTFSYDLIGKLDYFFASHEIEVIDKQYEEQVYYQYQSDQSWENEFSEITSGRCLPHYLETVTVETIYKKNGSD